MNDYDLRFFDLAISEAEKCAPEDERTHPKVGVVVAREGELLATAYRGELKPGDHAEFTALEEKLRDVSLSGCTVYTTLEPCTTRNHPRIPCAQWLIHRYVQKVFLGFTDPNPEISGRGVALLQQHNIAVQIFPPDLVVRVRELNRSFILQYSSDRNNATPASTLAPPSALREVHATDSATGSIIEHCGPGISLDIIHDGEGPAERIRADGQSIGEIIRHTGGTGTAKRIRNISGGSFADDLTESRRTDMDSYYGQLNQVIISSCEKCGNTLRFSQTTHGVTNPQPEDVPVRCDKCQHVNKVRVEVRPASEGDITRDIPG